jgi:hypothetical protein
MFGLCISKFAVFWNELLQALLGAIGVGEQSATVIGATFQVDVGQIH